MNRDHKKLADLLENYFQGKLGVYMIPPMFYGEVPEVVCPTETKDQKYFDRVKGDMAERAI